MDYILYPTSNAFVLIECDLFSSDWFGGVFCVNVDRLNTVHAATLSPQVYSDMPNYAPKPSFYDIKTNPLKFKLMLTNYENRRSPHLQMWCV